MRKRVIPMLLVATATACAPDAGPTGGADDAPRYEVTATVLQASGKPAMLCLGAILTSLPPQCGTMPITNWDWDQVDEASSAAGTTWGEYHLVGTFDGETFTLLDPPAPPRRASSEDLDSRFASPCPEPVGGWRPVDRSRTTDAAMRAALSDARNAPEFAGSWIDDRSETRSERQDPRDVVLNLAFTGSVEEHEREAREVWGGALCVSRMERTHARLESIQDELTRHVLEDLGLIVLSVGVDVVTNAVHAEVVAFDRQAEDALAERYGRGAVRLTAALTPVD